MVKGRDYTICDRRRWTVDRIANVVERMARMVVGGRWCNRVVRGGASDMICV
jgi:hypothetical protein